jgi:hypothetical protein
MRGKSNLLKYNIPEAITTIKYKKTKTHNVIIIKKNDSNDKLRTTLHFSSSSNEIKQDQWIWVDGLAN